MIEITQTKICIKCKIEYELLKFAFRTDTKKHRNICKKCTGKWLKEYNKKEKNKEKRACCQSKWRAANKEKIASWHKEHYKNNKKALLAKTKVYYQTAIGKVSKKTTEYKRRSITKQGDLTTHQLLELQQNAKVCYWCGVSFKKAKVHVDHYIPLSKGGEHTLSNLVISCSKCNQSKNSKDPFEFANGMGKLC